MHVHVAQQGAYSRENMGTLEATPENLGLSGSRDGN